MNWKWLCRVFGHKKLRRSVDEFGIPYPGWCDRCLRFVKDEIYEEQNRAFLAALKARMTTEEGRRFTEECERYGF